MTPPNPTPTALAEELERLAAKATPGLWEIDTERDEDAEYGSGPDCGRGFDDYLIGADIRGKWATILSTAPSDAKEIEEDYDEDWHSAWDAVGKANAELVVALRNNLPAILSALRAQPVDRDAVLGAFAYSHQVLESIARTNSTNFREVHERVLANRKVLAALKENPHDQA